MLSGRSTGSGVPEEKTPVTPDATTPFATSRIVAIAGDYAESVILSDLGPDYLAASGLIAATPMIINALILTCITVPLSWSLGLCADLLSTTRQNSIKFVTTFANRSMGKFWVDRVR